MTPRGSASRSNSFDDLVESSSSLAFAFAESPPSSGFLSPSLSYSWQLREKAAVAMPWPFPVRRGRPIRTAHWLAARL